MQFHIGNFGYFVRRKWELRLEGEAVDAFVSHRDCTIWIDGEIDEMNELLDTLRHEHYHACEWRMGGAGKGEEAHAQFVAFVGSTFDRDLAAGGGVEAVLALPVEGLRPGASKAMPAESIAAGDRRVCGACECEVTAGSIGNGATEDHGGGVFIRERYFQCPACGIVQVWNERCSSRGLALGGFTEARLLSGYEAGAYLRDHPVPHSPFVTA